MSKSFQFILNFLEKQQLPYQLMNGQIMVNDKLCLNLKEIFNVKIISVCEPQTEAIVEANNQLRSIQIWEDECVRKPDIILSRLSSILGLNRKIPARLCYVKRITKPIADAFLNENHLQGSVKSKLKFGLFLKKNYNKRFGFLEDKSEVLLAVSTFSGGRNFLNEDVKLRSFELIRFASLLNINVIGGFDKMIAAFVEDCNPDHLMTYIDAEWSDGSNYKQLGFEVSKRTAPIQFVVNLDTFERSIFKQDFDRKIEISISNAGNWKLEKWF